MLTVRVGPMSADRRANTALIEPSIATCRLKLPARFDSALFTFQMHEGAPTHPGIGKLNGAWLEYSVVSGSMPRSTMAAASPNGLKLDPACRRACAGRSNLVLR